MYYTLLPHQDVAHLWTDLRNRTGSVRDVHLWSSNLAIKKVTLPFGFLFYAHYVTNATRGTMYVNYVITKKKTCKSDVQSSVVKQTKSRSGRNTPFSQPQITICFY